MRSSASIAATSRCSLLVVAACAAAPAGPLGNLSETRVTIRRANDGEFKPRTRDCRSAGGFRPDLGQRLRAFAAEQLVVRPSRIAHEAVVETASDALLVDAAGRLRPDEIALVIEPRDAIGVMWLVHTSFQQIFCIHVRGDELVLEASITRITKTLE